MKDPKRIMTVFFIGMAMGAGYEFLNTVIFHHGTSVIQMASTDEQHGTARS